MPHVTEVDGNKIIIPRMTEIIATLDCEARAYLHPVNREETSWYTLSNAVALAGTMGHHRIENYIRNKMGLEEVELELSVEEQKLKDDIYKSNEGYLWLVDYIKTAFSNFLEWEYDFQPKYIKPEMSMVYIHRENDEVIPSRCVKGTVDLIVELDPEKMRKKARHIINLQEPSTVMLDWKTGRAKLDGHHAQLEGYDWLLDISGEREKMNETVVSKKWAVKTDQFGDEVRLAVCVRLGGFTYFADAYELNTGKFETAYDLFQSPRYIAKTRDAKYGNRGFREGYHCVFCPHRDVDCPIFRVQKVDLEVL